MLSNPWILIPEQDILYRVRHRIMEGDCQVEHGPVFRHICAFEILKYPVTNAEYVRFVEETGYHSNGNFLRHLREDMDTFNYDDIRRNLRGREKQPVTWVNLKDARAYAEYRGATLPSELQWYAAGGGADGRSWPWGEGFDPTRVNGNGDSLTDVDRYPDGASPYGIMDMIGNCWEFVGREVHDGTHLFAILRGGCHYHAAHFWHMQGGAHPLDSHIKMPLLGDDLNRSATVGFRLCREVG